MEDLSRSLTERIHQKEESEISLYPPFQGARMSIELTNYCNHRCIFCPCSEIDRKRRFIDEALFYRLIKEGFELGVRELGLHLLGEPLLNVNIGRFIADAKKLGYSYVYLTTNGSLATPDKTREILDAGLDSIKFSINGATRENYLAIHGRDDFETVKNNLACLSEYRKQSSKKFNIFVSFVVTDQSLEELRQFKKDFSIYADDTAFYRLLKRGGALAEKVHTSLLNVNLSDAEIIENICHQPFNAICVTCEGILAACCMDGDLVFQMADLNDTTLKEAWYSDKMVEFRKMHIEKTFFGTHCETCLRSGSSWATVLEI